MALRNPRYALLSFLLLMIVFAVIYLLSLSMRQWSPGYLVALAILIYTGTSLNRARTVTAPPRFPIMAEEPERLGLPPFEEISFLSRDRVDLSGWYIPSRNRGAVIMVHSLGSSRLQMRHFGRSLIENGYGVLLFDLRGHARSGGGMSTFGWTEHNDVLGAYDFLRARDDIDADRIGLVGFSMGAQIALRAAAESRAFSAVWVDGPIPIVYDDHFIEAKQTLRQRFFSPWWWLAYNTQEWLTGLDQPPPLVEVIGKLTPSPLMMTAAGSDRMIRAARRYFESAEEPKQFWQIDDIPFGSGILEKGEDYDLKLIGFFNKSL